MAKLEDRALGKNLEDGGGGGGSRTRRQWMRLTAQISRRLSFFCHGKCDAQSSWAASLQRKNSLMPTGLLGSPGEAVECGSRAIFDVPDLGTMGEAAGCAREEPTWSRQPAVTMEGQFTYTSLASSTLRVPGILSLTT